MPSSRKVTPPVKPAEPLQQLYEQLLEANQSAFELGLFTVAFHALSGALSCAVQLQRKDVAGQTSRLIEIERRAEEQIESLNLQNTIDVQNLPNSHLSFYRALEQLVDNQHALHAISETTSTPLAR